MNYLIKSSHQIDRVKKLTYQPSCLYHLPKSKQVKDTTIKTLRIGSYFTKNQHEGSIRIIRLD